MQTHAFSNGDQMPCLGLGTWKSQAGDAYRAVRTALDLGYRHIDCAAIYQNEAEIGQAFDETFRNGAIQRGQTWITSKLWNDSHAPEHVRPAIEKTLADLHLDYLDLYLMHWPVALRHGLLGIESASDLISLEELPLAVTWRAMEELVDAGLCRHIGVSNFSAAKLKSLCATARIKPAVNQVELHPYLQQHELLRAASECGVAITAYSPLGSPDRPEGMRVQGEQPVLQDASIGAIANRHHATPAQVLIAWAMQRGTSVIPKSTSPVRMQENLAATQLELDLQEMNQIARLDRNLRYVDGRFWECEGGPYTFANLWDV